MTALQAAVKLLATGERFEAELRRRLLEQGFPEEETASALARLQAMRVLSDERACQLLIQRWDRKSATGRKKIEQELIRRGLDPDDAEAIAEEARSEEADRERALRLLEAKFQPSESPARAYRYLVTRGFSAELAQSLVESYFEGG